MAVVAHRAEGLADTTVLTASNTGGAAGDAFNAVIGSPTASTTHAAHGTRSMRCSVAAASTSGGQDSTSLGTLTVVRGRLYLWVDGSPPANLRVAQGLSSGTLGFGVGLSTGRMLRLNDGASTQMAIGTSAIPTGQWVRIEWRVVASATVGQASAKVWFNAASTGTPDDTLSSAASFNTRASWNRYDTGIAFSASQTYTLYVDEAVWTDNDSGEIGPYVDPVTISADFEGGSPLAPFDLTSGVLTGASYAYEGSGGARLDSTAAAAHMRVGPTSTGAGRRYTSLRAWFRLPSGSLTDNAPLVRFRNTDPLASGGGGNGDVWVNFTDNSVRGDLQPADSFTGAAGLIQSNTWYLLRAVCGFLDDGTSSMKVAINGTQIGNITSTLPVVGEALAHVDFGSAAVNDSITDWDQITVTVSDSLLGYLAATIPVSVASETDAAQAVGKTKTKAAALASTSETAQPLAAVKTRTASPATETDTAVAAAKLKTRAVTLSTETDTAVAAGRTKTASVTVAAETDTAAAISDSAAITVGIASETNTAQAVVARTKTLQLTAAVETDTSQSPTRSKTAILVTAAAVETAQAVVRRKARTAGIASETDLAAAVATATGGAIDPAAETDTASALARLKTRAATVAVASEAAQAIAKAKTRATPLASETSTAIGLVSTKTRTVSSSAETDTGIAVGRSKAAAVGTASETGTAQTPGKAKARTLTVSAATETAQAAAASKARLVTTAAEVDTAGTLGDTTAVTLSPALETGAAVGWAAVKRRVLPVASATDIAMSFVITTQPNPTPAAGGSGWYGLLSSLREAREEFEAESVQLPQACPQDGEPLREGPDGQLFCPFDGWRPDGSYVTAGAEYTPSSPGASESLFADDVDPWF